VDRRASDREWDSALTRRDGLPESIRFWKGRIEESDADNTFSVGLLYEPSGCGKSSLVKAGLLPRLAGYVVTVFVEATAHDTELAGRISLGWGPKAERPGALRHARKRPGMVPSQLRGRPA
jgi:hypothetical protein